eukprot:TRINITY_DN23569_c0_g1_i1.p1 TRINITY_DN23569_c0_g1~~TRINITY_DN23569_c0_g1_i1.p1  ORF type:complete len:669 (-),score=137.70 TRINITY_DN23569_c0_g1_i1:8-2014(-)
MFKKNKPLEVFLEAEPSSGEHGKYRTDPRTGLKLLSRPPPTLAANFPELPDGLVHFFAEVQKVNRRGKHQQRVLAVSHNAVFISGEPSEKRWHRCFPIDEIKQIHVDPTNSYVAIEFPEQYDLLFRCSPASCQQLEQILQTCYEYRNDAQLPSQRSDLRDYQNRKKLLKIKKPTDWKTKPRVNVPITNFEPIDKWVAAEDELRKKRILVDGLFTALKELLEELVEQAERIQQAQMRIKKKEKDWESRLTVVRQEIEAIVARTEAMRGVIRQCESAISALQSDLNELEELEKLRPELDRLVAIVARLELDRDSEVAIDQDACEELERLRMLREDLVADFAPDLLKIVAEHQKTWEFLLKRNTNLRTSIYIATCRLAEEEGKLAAARAFKEQLQKHFEAMQVETRALKREHMIEVTGLVAETERLWERTELGREQFLREQLEDDEAFERFDLECQLREQRNASLLNDWETKAADWRNEVAELGHLAELQDSSNAELEQELWNLQNERAGRLCGLCRWYLEHPDKHAPPISAQQCVGFVRSCVASLSDGKVPDNFRHAEGWKWQCGTKTLKLRAFREAAVVPLPQQEDITLVGPVGCLKLADFFDTFGDVEALKYAARLRKEQREFRMDGTLSPSHFRAASPLAGHSPLTFTNEIIVLGPDGKPAIWAESS